jgi:hypothetical protein
MKDKNLSMKEVRQYLIWKKVVMTNNK